MKKYFGFLDKKKREFVVFLFCFLIFSLFISIYIIYTYKLPFIYLHKAVF